MCNLAAQAGVRYSLENPHAYIDSNIVGFLNVLEACRHHGVKNLSYASSSSVYGPWGRPDMAPFLFTKAAFNGDTIKVFNHGKMQRDFTYIDDIVEGVVRVIENPCTSNPDWNGTAADAASSSAPYRVYNIGNSKTVQLMDFIEAVEHAADVEIQKEFLPIQPGDVVATYADVSELERDFGYRPSTSVQEGMQRMVDWYREFYQV